MPVILVIEQDERVPLRVRQALEPDGWRVVHARWVTEGMQSIASEAPDLLLVAVQADGARDVLSTFARRRGGPGTVALLPEPPSGGAGGAVEADASLLRSFGGEELRRVVREILAGSAPSPARPERDEPKLTSQEIFGDLLAEVEPGPVEAPGEGSADDDDGGEADARRPPPSAAAGRPDDGPERETAPPPRAPRPAAGHDDVDRKLEQTLSGVLGRSVQGEKKPEASPGSRDAGAPAGSPPGPGQAARPRRGSEDVERLLSQTLSGLELPGERKKPFPKRPGPSTPDRPAAPSRGPSGPPEPGAGRPGAGESFELADLEALIERRQRRERAPAQEAARPGPATPAPEDEPAASTGSPPSPAPPPGAQSGGAAESPPRVAEPRPGPPAGKSPTSGGAGSEPGDPGQVPFRPRFADAMEEMADGLGAATADAAEGAAEPAADPRGSDQGPDQDPGGAPGGDFGQYRLLERIGIGGMAEVWKARMTGVEGFRKTVAIKRILPHLTDSSDFVDMFIDEAKLAAQLNHANIIHIYDLGKIGRDYYIAMEHVEGENLRSILNQSREEARPVPLGLALYVGARLSSALDYAHRKRDFDDREMGLVHRDVSPQNVLVGYEGTIKLCDFGIVKAVSKSSHTRMGALKGKLQYMSPEQAWGRPVDGRSDVFSLGALLFEMLTGRRLFAGESEMEVLEAVRECRIVPPSELEPAVPEAVDAVVLDALRADPDERFQSAGELERRLDEVLTTMRPSPGQAELAAYMGRLFRSEDVQDDGRPADGASGLDPDVSAERPPAPGAGPGARQPQGSAPAGTAPAEARSPSPPEVVPAGSEAPPAPGASGAGAPPTGRPEASPGAPPPSPPADAEAAGPEPPEDGAEAVEPVAAVNAPEVEEGGGRGKGLLVAAIVVAVLGGTALAWWVADRREALPWQEPAAAESPVQAPAQGPGQAPVPAPGDLGGDADPAAGSPAPGPGPGAGGEDAAPGAAGAPGAGEASTEPHPEGAGAGAGDQGATDPGETPDEELTRAVDEALQERLTRQEEELRRQFEAKERELQERLEALREQQRSAEPAPEPDPEPPTSPREPEPKPEPSPRPGADPSGATPNRTAGAAGSAATTVPAAATDGAVSSGIRAAATDPVSPGRGGRAPEAPPEPRTELAPEPRTEPAVEEGELAGMGPGVEAPQLVSFDKPEYPPVARRLRVQGVVVVSVLVDETGTVADVRLVQRVRQDVGLNEAALDAARTARYRPATKHGVRVKMWTTLRIPFQL